MEIFYLFEKPEWDDAIKMLSSQDDRTAVIVVTSILEHSLVEAINNVFRNRDNEVEGKFMRGYGPLASLSAKIDLGFLIGLYTKEARSNFHRVREIRNRMAHKITNVSFSHQEIKDQCAHLPEQSAVIDSWVSVSEYVSSMISTLAPENAKITDTFKGFSENYDLIVGGLTVNKRMDGRGKFMTYVQSRILSLRFVSIGGLNEAVSLLVERHL